jgi:hypothetical protein
MVKGCVLDSSDSGHVPVAGLVKGILCYRAAVSSLQACHVTAVATRMRAVCETLNTCVTRQQAGRDRNLMNCVSYISNYLVASE